MGGWGEWSESDRGSELMGLFNGLEESVDVVRGRSIEILSMFNSGG